MDNYNSDKLIYLVLFVIHLIFDENVNILLSKFDCTGYYYGYWATAYFRETSISTLINKRVLELKPDEDYIDNYRDKYISSGNKEESTLVHETTSTVDTPSKLLKILVGASAATLFLGSILKFGLNKLKFWKNTDSSGQVMFTLGCVGGSLKLYGFCLEKEKPSPRKDSSYENINFDKLDTDVSNSAKRIHYFIKYFIEFINTKHSRVIRIAKLDHNIIWYHFQLFFWLITQPFSENDEDSWKQFVMSKRKEQQNIQEIEFGLEAAYSVDENLVTLCKRSTEILQNLPDAIHLDNKRIFLDITENLNE